MYADIADQEKITAIVLVFSEDSEIQCMYIDPLMERTTDTINMNKEYIILGSQELFSEDNNEGAQCNDEIVDFELKHNGTKLKEP